MILSNKKLTTEQLTTIKKRILGLNALEKEWTHMGLPCIVLMTTMGHRCGYVGVPEGHPAFEVQYDDDKLNGIYVHGGLTYSSSMELDTDIYYLDSINLKDYWWLGFDCAHAGDRPDYETALKIFEGTKYKERIQKLKSVMEFQFYIDTADTIKDLEFCVGQCEVMAEHLASMK